MITVNQISCKQHMGTGKFVASCYSPTVGRMEQWSETEIDALRKLKEFVEGPMNHRWPPIETN